MQEATLGSLFTCREQTHGTFVIRVERAGEYNGFRTLTGTIVRGTETSRLLQHKATRDITGERATVYGVTDAELAAGECTRAHCG